MHLRDKFYIFKTYLVLQLSTDFLSFKIQMKIR